MPKNYSQKDFEKDLNELEDLIKQNNDGPRNDYYGNYNNNGNNNGNYYGGHYDEDNDEDNDNNNNYQGGANSEEKEKKRHFRVVELRGKMIHIGSVHVKMHNSPLSAAKKLLTSIAEHDGLSGHNKAKLPTTVFCIQEITRGSKNKIYGPYTGKFHKYTPEEVKKASAAGQHFHMKAVVSLYKGEHHMKHHKGEHHDGKHHDGKHHDGKHHKGKHHDGKHHDGKHHKGGANM